MKIGIITYDVAHLKTEQLVCRYLRDNRIKDIKLFALPFTPRKERDVIFRHRPDQSKALPTESLSEIPKVSFQRWDGKQVIESECDLFIIAGAGILDVAFAKGKPIVNGHPGIIPLTRGLDSFKWAIFNNDPVGITLHLIDREVDKGDIISIVKTPVFSTDNLESLARRHYELEIEMLVGVLDVINNRIFPQEREKPATRRMNLDTEAIMVGKFDEWKQNIVLQQNC